MFVNVEMTNGEGIISRLLVTDTVPPFVRWYFPLKDENGQELLKCILDDPKINDFYTRCEARPISIQAVPANTRYPGVVEMNILEAKTKIVEAGLVPRVVMEDGLPMSVDANTLPNRVNLWVSDDVVYRAEIF